MSGPWNEGETGSRLASRLARPLRGLVRRFGASPDQWALLLESYLVMERRGGPCGRVGSKTRLVRALFPGFLLAFGFLLGASALSRTFPPLQWMAGIQIAAWSLLAYPLSLSVETLLDRSDREVLGALPVSRRVFVAVRMTRVVTSLLPPTVALLIGPLVLGGVRYPVLAVALGLPLATLLTLISMVGAFTMTHALLLRLFGRRGLGRLALLSQVVLLAGVMGGGALVVSLLGPFFLGTAATVLAQRGPMQFVVPPIQLGGLFALLCGDGTARTLELAAVSFATPALLVIAALLLEPRGRAQDASPRDATAQDLVLPRAWRKAGPGCRGTTPPERAGFALARALTRRDPVILRSYWPPTLGVLALLLLSTNRLAASLGGASHWLALTFWLACMFPWLAYESTRASSHPEATWMLRGLSSPARERFFRGVVRGAWWSLSLPTAIGLVVLAPWVMRQPRAAFDLILMVELAFVLSAWTLARIHHPLPFTGSPPSVQPASGRGATSRPLRWHGLHVRLLIPLLILVHALLHAIHWLVVAAALALLPLLARAVRGEALRSGDLRADRV